MARQAPPPGFEAFRRELFALRGDDPPGNLVVLSSVDSTNLLARRILGEYAGEGERSPDFLLVAFEQTAGRGRGTRSWASGPGLGVYATRVFSLADLGRLQTLPLLIAVALAREVNGWLGGSCRLKWPNDLLVGGAKLGGILLETVLSATRGARVIAGFGVNYESPATQPSVRPATSLRAEAAGELPSLAAVARRLLVGLDRCLDTPGSVGDVVEAYRELAIHRAGDRLTCRTAGQELTGVFVGFDENGFLRLANEQGEVLLAAGEVVER